MAAPSFNLKMINIFIGLFMHSKNKFLRKYAENIFNLGYQLIQIEPTFPSDSGRVNPEALAYSESRGHSLQVEWTELSNPNHRKISQIRRYSRVTPQDIDSAFSTSSNAISTWLITASHCVEDYCQILDAFPSNTYQKLMLSSFTSKADGNFFEQQRGVLQDSKLFQLLNGGLSVKRISYDYVKIDLENLQATEIIELTIRQLLEFHIRKKNEFTNEEIASEAFGVWDFLSFEKKKALKGRILDIMKDICKNKGSKHIERVQNEPPTWTFKQRLSNFQRFALKYIQTLNT